MNGRVGTYQLGKLAFTAGVSLSLGDSGTLLTTTGLLQSFPRDEKKIRIVGIVLATPIPTSSVYTTLRILV
jgi:hypothetical protein